MKQEQKQQHKQERKQEYKQQYKELAMYIIFGGLTTVVSIGSFWLFAQAMGINELAANVFSWILAVLFAYITNRKWVFNSDAKGARNIMEECGKFYGGRLFSLGVEELIILIFITILGMNKMVVKFGAQVIVMVLNYIISKVIVFKNK